MNFTSSSFPSLLPFGSSLADRNLQGPPHQAGTWFSDTALFSHISRKKGHTEKMDQRQRCPRGICIFTPPHRILKVSTPSSASKALKWLAIPSAALPHFNSITAPREAKKNIISLPSNIVTLFWPPRSSPVTLTREKVVIGCQNMHTAKAFFKSPTCV